MARRKGREPLMTRHARGSAARGRASGARAGTAQPATGPEFRTTDAALEDATSVFTRARPLLFGIAYRMLGSATEAEDVLQETWLRWREADHPAIANPPAFLALITTRLAINTSKSARSRREISIGRRPPEFADGGTDLAAGAERGEALELALLVLLQRLTPTERAVYILREAFDYPHSEIAEIVRISPDNARQLFRRARKRLTTAHRKPIDRAEHRRLVRVFRDASRSGNIAALEDLFASASAGSRPGGGIGETAPLPADRRRAA
ncbi:sigma-70 family RNA polymerase sigma factor [Actinomadura sp. NPDC049382]|uniref:sigma-70 family RNA polymerase sigma factor n=1 Tax=Actinomadura sp. NPDC049382 TaxID=3158220 RepID=UPI003436AD7B